MELEQYFDSRPMGATFTSVVQWQPTLYEATNLPLLNLSPL